MADISRFLSIFRRAFIAAASRQLRFDSAYAIFRRRLSTLLSPPRFLLMPPDYATIFRRRRRLITD